MKIAQQVIKYLILISGIAIMILPFLWMISTSLKTGGVTMVFPPKFLPNPATLANYKDVFSKFPMLTFLINSIAVAILTTVGTIIVATMAAYAFARMHFKGRDKIFLLYLATMMIPAQVTMIPQFILLKNIGWIDSYQGLIVPNVFGVFAVFLMRQAFLGLPKELEEAAFIDGANHLTVCFKVLLPLVKPTIATLGIFTFMQSWNNYLWPLIITSSKNMATLPLGLAMLQGQYATNWNLVMAGVVISVIPILAVYIFAQKYFIQGMTMAGMKE
ncbi:N-Acetyl-D-glucosamine ABC transport system permease protein 2 [Lactococcus cremoris]|uniref:N-Acetyl-D-glucosamine ABC transport system permease protein 2 n=1 Tax=Lactococcus lactis subsp. cremoris TaxID=1359 RepID=A0A166JMY8_LACLC|nr:carbohydrate ABC transporter permease [Lactococcus cremoris]KZK06433.1 N-Acetyl-D-glucosamine ABC transport system permease protein 2 [Lactococcus cremoris]